ncbi:MAG TPA: Crp/Fnr family transcriptional regulator [Phototrophicaceae bacterium]|nr:Crp/Fnr family transcriptional regulator [Phototrophicaceae bacterium]
MADRFILSHLKRLPVFARLSAEQLERVANSTQALRYEVGEVVFQQGQIHTGLTLLVSGRGLLTQIGPTGQEQIMAQVVADQYLNESALFKETVALATLRIVETAIIIGVLRQSMAAALTQPPNVPVNQPSPSAASPLPASESDFKGQRGGEKVLTRFRAHWWAFVHRLWMPLMVSAILIALAIVAGSIAALAVLLVFLGFLLPAVFAVYLFFEWRNDEVIITDQRIIRIRRSILAASTNISEIPIAAIHEVNVAIPETDLPARLFNYGRLTIKTSGDTLNLTLTYVPEPKAVQKVLFANRDRYQETMAQQNREAMRKELDVFLGRTPPAGQPAVPAVSNPNKSSVGFLQMRFVNNKGETVYRKHYLVWLSHILLPALVLLVGLVLLVVAAVSAGSSPTAALAGLGGSGILIVVAAGMLYLADWDWRNDRYVVGDQTVALIHKRPLWLQDKNDQILVSQIDNVISETSGVLNSLFHMGDVKLLLTGTEVENAKVFKNVHRPQEIQQELAQRRRRAEQRQEADEAKRQRQAILDYLAVYHDSLQDVAPNVNPNSGGNTAPRPAEPPPPTYDRTRPPGIPRVLPNDPPHSG